MASPPTLVISGGGIVGMVLALAIKKHLGIIPEIYEKARGFAEDVGAALGVYPNGLRVLRDIDPEIVQAIRNAGSPYLYRIWEKHDGTSVAVAKEDVLAGGEEELMSVGIKRWKLQDVLYAAIEREGIPLFFRKETVDVVEQENGCVEVVFADGTSRVADVFFCAEGAHSKVRAIVDPTIQLEYTGITCLMGIAKCPIRQQAIHFPSSVTSHFHAVYFPVSKTEQCFQIHFPIKEEDSDKRDWGNLTKADGLVEFSRIAQEMTNDGWAEQFTDPLYQVDHAVRVGFALMSPRMDKWVFGKQRRIVLLGDACHPPVRDQ
jgi:2-polyprenyl-6-methoxyphenol hydroxylase-like FAD-dependent oxidoreductase